MLKVGLTGGIASGKSVVGKMLVELGAHLIQADGIAHDLMQPGQPVYAKVVGAFGSAILNPDGTVNRGRLAEAAFGLSPSGSRIQELNKIVHPAVVQKHDEWMEAVARTNPKAVAVVEAALLLEAGAKDHFDRLIVVTCQPEQRIERWVKRTGVDRDAAQREVERRMSAQWPDETKIKAADFVIDNSGSLEQTNQRVREVYATLEAEAASR